MNILFLYGGEINPQRGGVQRVTAVLADEFARRGNGVFYLALPQNRSNEADKARQFYLPESDFFTAKNCEFIGEFISLKKIDVIVNQCGFSSEAMDLLGSVKEKCPIISVLHNSPLAKIFNFSSAFQSRFPKFLRGLLSLTDLKIVKAFLLSLYKFKYRNHYPKLLETSVRTVLLSEGFKKEVEFFVGSSSFMNRVIAIPNPCSFSSSEKECVKKNQLLYVGRIELGQKRVDLLIDIWRKLCGKFSDWKLVIVGDGTDLQALKEQVCALEIPRVEFLGKQDPRSYYEESKIFCMTSSYEGFGIVLVEAMNYGCVPIAFDSFASVRDIIEDKRSGLLVPPFDCATYAERVATLMNDELMREELAERGKARVIQKFSIASIVDRWEALFSRVVEEKC